MKAKVMCSRRWRRICLGFPVSKMRTHAQKYQRETYRISRQHSADMQAKGLQLYNHRGLGLAKDLNDTGVRFSPVPPSGSPADTLLLVCEPKAEKLIEQIGL